MKGRCLLLAVVSIGVVVADEPCRPIDGLEPLLKAGNVLLLGELHGTVESPAFVFDVACHAAGKGLPVVVGLELWPGEQERVDAFLESMGTDEDRDALLEGPTWQSSYQDGRNSRAMLDLIDGLRKLRAGELPVRLALFDASGKAGGQQRERDMARNLAAAGEDDWYSGRVAIRPDEDPAEIDFAIEDCHCSYKGMTSKAIYRWEGESIVVSAPTPGNPRPQRFVESAGQMMRLLHEGRD